MNMAPDRPADTGKAISQRPKYVFVVPWDVHPRQNVRCVNQIVINLYREMLSAGEMQPLIMVNKW